MPSKRSSCSNAPAGLVSALVSNTASGSGLPVLTALTVTPPEISVCDGLFGSLLGMNSCTVPMTHTSFPTAAAEGGAAEVNTKMPSDVAGSPSPLDGIWTKNPFDFRPVTMPSVWTVMLTSGDVLPLP